jgi:hypothetical protein
MGRCVKQVHRRMSETALKAVPFWTYFKAKRYHVLTFRVFFRTAMFCGAIYGCIALGDYLHIHPIITATAGVGFQRYTDRFVEVLNDCLCDRIFPGEGGTVST